MPRLVLLLVIIVASFFVLCTASAEECSFPDVLDCSTVNLAEQLDCIARREGATDAPSNAPTPAPTSNPTTMGFVINCLSTTQLFTGGAFGSRSNLVGACQAKFGPGAQPFLVPSLAYRAANPNNRYPGAVFPNGNYFNWRGDLLATNADGVFQSQRVLPAEVVPGGCSTTPFSSGYAWFGFDSFAASTDACADWSSSSASLSTSIAIANSGTMGWWYMAGKSTCDVPRVFLCYYFTGVVPG